MIRLIKRYESRKLYDTEESRYVSLQEVAAFVRAGQQVMVVESASGEDVTTQTLAQVILEEGRSGERGWSPEMLHELLRRGERMMLAGAEQMQHGVDSLLRGSLGRLQPVREANDELDRLRDKLDELEGVLEGLESKRVATGESRAPGKKKATRRKKVTPSRRSKGRAARTKSGGER